MATPPGFSPPGSIHMLTHVVVRQEFLLNPDRSVNQNIYYLLGYMQKLYGVKIHSVAVLSNHIHLILTDVLGDQVARFNHHFFTLLAKSMNAYRGRSGSFFEGDRPNDVILAPLAETLIDKSAYLSNQATAAGLVSHVKKWPGVMTHPGDQGKLQLKIDRPQFFYAEKGKTPESVEFRLTLPECVEIDPERLRQEMVKEHNRRERSKRDQFKREGRTFMGEKRILRQSIHSSPKMKHPLFARKPRVACSDPDLRKRFLSWRKERLARYREFVETIRNGTAEVVFPVGTFVLHFRLGFPREDWTSVHPTGCIWRALMSGPISPMA